LVAIHYQGNQVRQGQRSGVASIQTTHISIDGRRDETSKNRCSRT